MFGSLKNAYDLAKDLTALQVSAEYNSKISQLFADILAAREEAISKQEERAALLSEIRQLKEQAAQREDWLTEKQRYELHHVEPGAAIFLLKPSAAANEAFHALCAQCFNAGKKGYLQPTTKEVGWKVTHRCSCCSTDTVLDKSQMHELSAKHAGAR